MDGQQIEDKWKAIGLPKNAKFAYQRIDSVCIPELRLGVSFDGNRCLILKLNSKLKYIFREADKENLKIYYDTTESSIVLELIDPFYNRLFIDLVNSLYHLLKNIQKEDESTPVFINTVRYWSDFLKAKRSQFLSEEMVQGLYGELVFLEYLIDNSGEPINHILNSWRGPFRADHDFHFFDKNIEVKTKRKNSNYIYIASEFQLQAEAGKELELAIITIVLVKDNGDTLGAILNRIRIKTINAGGLVSILTDALNEMKLTFIVLEAYDSYQFQPESIDFHNCDDVYFPKLNRALLNDSIQDVSYKLELTTIPETMKLKTIKLI
jgi:hypothetical protein